MTHPSTTTPSDQPSRRSTTTTPKPASEIELAAEKAETHEALRAFLADLNLRATHDPTTGADTNFRRGVRQGIAFAANRLHDFIKEEEVGD